MFGTVLISQLIRKKTSSATHLLWTQQQREVLSVVRDLEDARPMEAVDAEAVTENNDAVIVDADHLRLPVPVLHLVHVHAIEGEFFRVLQEIQISFFRTLPSATHEHPQDQ